MGLLGFFFCFWAVAMALTPLALIPSAGSHNRLFSLALAGVCFLSSRICAVIGLPYLVNALRPGPALIIDAAGLDDRRLKMRLRWDDICRAQIRYGRAGLAALALRTHDLAPKRTGRFHSGAFWRRGDHIVIPLQFLTPSPGLAAQLMAKMIEGAGGAVEGKPFWVQ